MNNHNNIAIHLIYCDFNDQIGKRWLLISFQHLVIGPKVIIYYGPEIEATSTSTQE